MFKKKLTFLIMLVVILGCYSKDFELKIRFAQVEGLKAGDRIIFEQNHIGKVGNISYSKDGNYTVGVEIKKDFKNAVTEHSRFFITKDPSNKSNKVIEMVKMKKAGLPLQDGTIVDGSTRLSTLLNKMEDDFSRIISEIKSNFDKFSKNLKKLPENKEIKKLQKDLDQVMEEMKKSGGAFREKVQKELLPKLQKGIEKLKEKLRKFGHEKEVEPLEVKVKEMMKI